MTGAMWRLPPGRITVNLAPADLPKEGGRFDLPIAVGILIASGQLAVAANADLIVVLTDHDAFDWDLVGRYGDKVLDTRNRLPRVAEVL